MIVYKEQDGEKVLDYIQCDKCGAVCNKFGARGGIHITLPAVHPDLPMVTEEDKLKGKDFCAHHCAISFMEDCQKEMFKLNMKKLMERSE